MKKRKLKTILFCLLVAFLLFSPIQKARADAWGMNIAAAILKQTMEQIAKMIQDFLMGTMKQMAVQSIVSSVSGMISGGGGGEGPMFITDYSDFLTKQPQEATSVYMNDFFTLTSRGKGSSLNYISSEGTKVAGGYASQMVSMAKNYLGSGSQPGGDGSKIDLQNYAQGTEDLFSKKNWRAYSAFISNPANNPFGYTLMAQDAAAKKLEEEEKKAQTQAIANQGFKSTTKGGNIVTPGSLVKDIQSQTQDLGNQALASANSLPEIITALVTRMAVQTLSQGVGNVQSQMQQGIAGKFQGLASSLSGAATSGLSSLGSGMMTGGIGSLSSLGSLGGGMSLGF